MTRSNRGIRAASLGVAAAILLPFAAGPSHAQGANPGPTLAPAVDAARDGAGLFAELLATPSPLRPIHVAQRLLEVGPAETEAFFRAFESATVKGASPSVSTAALVRVGRAVRDSGALLVSMIERSDIPDAARVDATAVAVDVLRRDLSAPSLALCTRLLIRLRSVEPSRQQALGPRFQLLARAYATAGVGTDAAVVALVQAVAPPAEGDPLPLQDSVLEGLATGTEPSACASRLMEVFKAVPALRGGVLNKVHGIARRHVLELDLEDRRQVRTQLSSEDPFLRRESAFVLGFVDDQDSITHLIQALDDSASTVRAAAHESLARMTAMTISSNKARWQYWLERQQAWWKGEGEKTLAQIRTAPLQDLVPLLKTVASKRLFHHQISPVLIELTSRGDSRYGDLALSALAILRAPETVPAIRALTGHKDQVIRLRAEQALSEMGAPLLDLQRANPTSAFAD